MAYPWSRTAQALRDGTRLNQILLVRCDPAKLSRATRAGAVEGVVAYSAICTHAGCEVRGWDAGTATLECPCHQSRFDPRQGGQVVAGPARRRLARLPLAVQEGALVVAGGFVGKVGFEASSQPDAFGVVTPGFEAGQTPW